MRKWYFISPVLVLAVWSVLTYGSIVNTIIIPHPHKVFFELLRYSASGEALADILSTAKRLFCGLAIGSAIGIIIGLLLGYFTKGYEALEFAIDFFRSIPATALFPIFMLLLGFGDSSRIMMIVYGVSFIMLINTVYGVRNGKKLRVEVAKVMGASNWDILAKVVLPDALPYIATGLRIAISLALAITIVSEMFIGANAGLGYRIMESKILYNIPNVFAALLITGLLGYALNNLFILIEKRVMHWGGK